MREYAKEREELIELRNRVAEYYARIIADKHVNPAHYQYAYEEYHNALGIKLEKVCNLMHKTTANCWQDKQEDAEWYTWLNIERAKAEGERYIYLFDLTGDTGVF
ncbi:hypothetical protein [Bacillus cereus group sp. BfR-BA-01518]|uniref:hypothetical protein n=1 Tax=Bacillus cereus group sp. BfR-BA-01518 TaxID=2920368 RepID=UPI001F572630|nr:hypothetical protein [Bacillus cereus group sp. BfR-BA-01518]